MNDKGIGVLLNWLSDSGETTLKAIEYAKGKKITNLKVDDALNGGDGMLVINLEGGAVFQLWDAGRSCCESRYMTTGDQLSDFIGATLVEFEIEDAPDGTSEYGEEHEIQFLIVTTDKGKFTLETHNEHNGYYGGFYMKADCVGT